MAARNITRRSNIFTLTVGADATRLLTQNDKRRAAFLQNQDAVNGIEFCTVSGQNPGFILPATGAFLSDAALTEEIWARSIGGANVNICVMEVIGFDAYETEVLNALDRIAVAVEKLAKVPAGGNKLF